MFFFKLSQYRLYTTLMAAFITVSSPVSAALDAAPGSIHLKTELAHPLMIHGASQTTTLKISLEGTDHHHPHEHRPAVNLAIVLDKSGSMQGQKIHHARQAAIMAVQRLTPRDVVSVVSYDDEVETVWAASHVNDKRAIVRAIQTIKDDGSTALYAGVEAGAGELQRYLEQQAVNRVILLSDGLANVGPSSTEELAQLGQRLGQQGISVTTIGLGLGYNEDLMTELAGYSDGNHAFAENATDLARIFDQELQSTFAVIANGAEIHIHCHPNITPLKVIGRKAEIHGQQVKLDIGQLYRGQEKFVLLEVRVGAGQAQEHVQIADISAQYRDLSSGQTVALESQAEVIFTDSEELVEKQLNRELLVTRVEQLAVEQKREAIELRDAGQIQEAEGVMGSISRFLRSEASRLDSDALLEEAEANDQSSAAMEGDWNRARKKLKEEDYRKTRQAY